MTPTDLETKQTILPQCGVVIFDSRYGNTERIARALATGFRQAGIEIACFDAKEITNIESLREYDLIAVGAPTENHTASAAIKQFLAKLERLDLNGKSGFAFDTRYDFPIGTGSSAKFIEKKLKKCGLSLIYERASARVVEQKEKAGGVILKDGEERRFENMGVQLGTTFLATKRVTIPA